MRKQLAILLMVFTPALLGAQSADIHRRMKVPASTAQIMIRRAIAGASRRLADPRCKELLADFSDAAGNTLWDNLNAAGVSPAQYLSRVWFVDGTGESPCNNASVAAFTSPG